MTKQPEPRHITLAYLMQKYHGQSMLERIAAVIGQNLYVESNIEIARRVLTAMRKPSEAMIDGAEKNAIGDTGFHNDVGSVDIWQAMIDAALEEQ